MGGVRTSALALLQLAELLFGLAVLHLAEVGAFAGGHGQHGPNAALSVSDAVLIIDHFVLVYLPFK
jgi:hypothetical protein